MFNPLQALQTEIDNAKAAILRQVHIDIARETAIATLSRLSTLDADRAADYQTAVKAIS